MLKFIRDLLYTPIARDSTPRQFPKLKGRRSRMGMEAAGIAASWQSNTLWVATVSLLACSCWHDVNKEAALRHSKRVFLTNPGNI